MSYRGLGANLFGSDTDVLNDARYLGPGEALTTLQGVANDAVTLLLSGRAGGVRVGDEEVAYVQAHPEIAAIFGGNEQTARILGATVLETIILQERKKSSGWLSGLSIAWALPNEIATVMRNGGDPFACKATFEESFKNWAAISAISVPKTQSKTGWCQKSLALPWKSGHVTSCAVQSVCKSGTKAGTGAMFLYEAPPPPPSDPRVPVTGGAEPEPPPTKAEIEADVRRKMEQSGETLVQAKKTQAWTELAAYLTSLSESKKYLIMGLGLPPKATDAAIVAALSTRGIPTSEALDWFYGCNFDTNCFRQTMNLALGESDDRARDRVTKAVVILGAAAAIGLYLWKVR